MCAQFVCTVSAHIQRKNDTTTCLLATKEARGALLRQKQKTKWTYRVLCCTTASELQRTIHHSSMTNHHSHHHLMDHLHVSAVLAHGPLRQKLIPRAPQHPLARPLVVLDKDPEKQLEIAAKHLLAFDIVRASEFCRRPPCRCLVPKPPSRTRCPPQTAPPRACCLPSKPPSRTS